MSLLQGLQGLKSN